MKSFNVLALTVAATVVLASSGLAADTKSPQIWHSTDLIGKTVKNTANETLGSIEDVVIDAKHGKIVYVAVAHGEVLGFGGKLFAVDPRLILQAQDNSCAILELKKADLDNAKGFDANQWPTEPDSRWQPNKKDGKEEAKKEVKEVANKVADKEKEHDLRRISNLTGMTVRGTDNTDLGRLRGFALNLLDEKVVYTVLAYGGVAGVGTKYYAVPWNALDCKAPDLKEGNNAWAVDACAVDTRAARVRFALGGLGPLWDALGRRQLML
jgi:sporulation protein YlmC with PRC-barrel domain